MSYADVASENFQLWNVNQKKIGVIRELVKKSKQVRLAIRVYFFGKWNRYANRRYLKLAFRGFKKNWEQSTSYERLAKIFMRRDATSGYDSQDDDAYERERRWIPQCFGNHAVDEDCLQPRTSQSFYYAGPKCAHIIAFRIQNAWKRYKAYKVAHEKNPNVIKWYAMRPEYSCYHAARDILAPIVTADVFSVIESYINFKEWREDWLNRTIWLNRTTVPTDSIWFPNQTESVSARSLIKGRGGAYVLVAKQVGDGLQMKAYILIKHFTSTIFLGKMVKKIELSKCSGCRMYPFTFHWEKEEDKGVLTEYGQVDAEFRRIDLGKKVVLKIGCFKDIAERQRFSQIFWHYAIVRWDRLKSKDGIYPRVANQVKLGAKAYFTDTGLYSSHV